VSLPAPKPLQIHLLTNDALLVLLFTYTYRRWHRKPEVLILSWSDRAGHRFRSRVARADQQSVDGRQQAVEPEPEVLTLFVAVTETGSTHRAAVKLCIARVTTYTEI